MLDENIKVFFRSTFYNIVTLLYYYYHLKSVIKVDI